MLKKTQESTDAVAPVIGFMLILAILFLAASQYQLNVVPVEERSTEIDHFKEVTEDMSGLRSSIIQTASTGQIQTQELQLGTSYDILGLSQPPSEGSLTFIGGQENITIDNATNNKESGNFWRGDETKKYETGFLKYNIGYNRVTNHADVFIEHGLMYQDTARDSDEYVDLPGSSDNPILESDQSIINGRSITLYTIQSNIGSSRTGSVTVETNPTSAPMNSVSIENVDDGSPIQIEIPTRLSVEDWRNILEGERTVNNGYVSDIMSGSEDDTIIIELEEDETYNLRMSRIDLSTQNQRSTTPNTDEQYVAVETNTANVREGSSIQLDAEVRDKYNNGVIGIPVHVEAQDSGQECVGDFKSYSSTSTDCDNSGYQQPGEDISSSDGSVTYQYSAPETVNDRDITFTYKMITD